MTFVAAPPPAKGEKFELTEKRKPLPDQEKQNSTLSRPGTARLNSTWFFSSVQCVPHIHSDCCPCLLLSVAWFWIFRNPLCRCWSHSSVCLDLGNFVFSTCSLVSLRSIFLAIFIMFAVVFIEHRFWSLSIDCQVHSRQVWRENCDIEKMSKCWPMLHGW